MRVLNFYLLCKGLCSKPYSLLKYSYYLFSSLSTVNISVKGDVLMEFQQLHKQRKKLKSRSPQSSGQQVLNKFWCCVTGVFMQFLSYLQFLLKEWLQASLESCNYDALVCYSGHSILLTINYLMDNELTTLLELLTREKGLNVWWKKKTPPPPPQKKMSLSVELSIHNRSVIAYVLVTCQAQWLSW